MKFFKGVSFLLLLCALTACNDWRPRGENSGPLQPFFITTKPMLVKKMLVPAGTRVVYEEHFYKEGEQDEMMPERKISALKFPKDEIVYWGGVPITAIERFFNSEMRGFSVYANFEVLSSNQETGFSKMWQSCSEDLGITLKKMDDWSFNTKNIADVESCSVLYQRYFKKNKEQQAFLDAIYAELLKVGPK
ncbi:MAG: hypothetical protein ABI263_00755 [Gelidibacter sp.]